MEHGARSGVATFFVADEPLVTGGHLSLGERVARHARALRLGAGSVVRLADGAGRRAEATVIRMARDTLSVDVGEITSISPPAAVHLLIPVADRDRMLWLAEKSVELEASSWRPVLWRRSKSVKPRGEGIAFAHRVRGRMTAALEQSGASRLPMVFPEAAPDRALAAAPEGTRILLDDSGPPLLSLACSEPVSLAVGPEGGLDTAERSALEAARFVPASLGRAILRFETAAVAGLAITRAMLATSSPSANGH